MHSPALPDDGLEFVKSESLIRDMQPEREGDISIESDPIYNFYTSPPPCGEFFSLSSERDS